MAQNTFLYFRTRKRETAGWQEILVHNFAHYMKAQASFEIQSSPFGVEYGKNCLDLLLVEVHLLRIRYRIASMDTPPEGATNLVLVTSTSTHDAEAQWIVVRYSVHQYSS